jgi:hypothetical protein
MFERGAAVSAYLFRTNLYGDFPKEVATSAKVKLPDIRRLLPGEYFIFP